MCAAMVQTGLSALMTEIGQIDTKQTAGTSSMHSPLTPLPGTVDLTERLLKLSATGGDQTDPAIPNKKDSLTVSGIAVVILIIHVVLVRPEGVTGLAVLLSIVLRPLQARIAEIQLYRFRLRQS